MALAAALPARVDGQVAHRDQALAQLRQVAEFFRRTEPHSPVAYLAEKAARWGEQPLHAWLRSVIKDDASLARLEDLLGIEHPAP
jgi:type VI secretion system protein ImpA